MSNWLGYFLGNFWKNLGYLLFHNLFTLLLNQIHFQNYLFLFPIHRRNGTHGDGEGEM